MYNDSLRAFLGPILKYLNDRRITEIMINGPEDVWVERDGLLYKTKAQFNPEGLEAAVRNGVKGAKEALQEIRGER